MVSRQSLIDAVSPFLQAIKTASPSTDLQKHFTTNPTPLIYEHGLPRLAPFLGRPFKGTEGVSNYFKILSETLSIKEMNFENPQLWVVDESTMTISLRGQGRFESTETEQYWDETFIYRLGLACEVGDDGDDSESDCVRISEYRIWADTGAAYLALSGELS